MDGCQKIRTGFPGLLRADLAGGEEDRLLRHLAACESCAGEWAELRRSWDLVPSAVGESPPARVRERILAYAGAHGTPGVAAEIARAAAGGAIPTLLGVGGALAVVGLFHLRGALAPLEPGALVAVSLALAGLLTVATEVFLRATGSRAARAAVLGAFGALGGYLLLSLAFPISETVRFCQVSLLGNPALSTGELCLVYAAVAVLYGGGPMAIAAYVFPVAVGEGGVRVGVAAAVIFSVLVAPTLVFKMGIQDWVITSTVLAGLIAGGMVGGAFGAWARGRRTPIGLRA